MSKTRNSGNRYGETPSTRDKLSSAFVQALEKDWAEHGSEVIQQIRQDNPVKYGELIARLIPMDANLSDKCRRCTNAVYASQVLGKRTRPILQALRLETFLKLKSYMGQRNRRRLKSRIPKTHSRRLDSKRLSHHTIQLPHSNYSTRGAMHWR